MTACMWGINLTVTRPVGLLPLSSELGQESRGEELSASYQSSTRFLDSVVLL